MKLLGRLFPPGARAQQRFDERFDPLRNTVFDADAVFSGSAMSGDLRALHLLALRVGKASRAMGDLLWLEFVVLNKRQMPAEALPLGLSALDILSQHGPSIQQTFDRHYAIGRAAMAADDHAMAIHHLRQASVAAEQPDGPPLDASQRLSIQEDIGFALHEEGRFAEALVLNRALLAAAQLAFGPGPDARLAGVLNNIAQNAHKLGDTMTAQNHLQQRLELSLALRMEDTTDDTLFQLGVLAHEASDNPQALAHFEHRLALARSSQDDDRIASAGNALAELQQRIGAPSIDPRARLQ